MKYILKALNELFSNTLLPIRPKVQICDCGSRLTSQKNYLICDKCNNYYVLRTNRYGHIIRGLKVSTINVQPMSFSDWYRAYHNKEWNENIANYLFAIDISNEYEDWCKKNKIEPNWDG